MKNLCAEGIGNVETAPNPACARGTDLTANVMLPMQLIQLDASGVIVTENWHETIRHNKEQNEISIFNFKTEKMIATDETQVSGIH